MIFVNDIMEMTLSPSYTLNAVRRLRLLKLLRIVLLGCLVLSWTYGISVAAALIQQASGAATHWILFFVIFTIPATALLILVHLALVRLTREYDYCLTDDILEVYVSNGKNKRKLLLQINCFTITAFLPASEAAAPEGKVMRAILGKNDLWALDFRDEERKIRVLLQPNEVFCRKLTAYTK